MSTLWKKLWCIMLSLALFLSLLPMSVGATETSVEQQAVFNGIEVPNLETNETKFQQTLTENTEGTQAVIVCEDVTLRDEFVKHFQMSDGSYTATVYNARFFQYGKKFGGKRKRSITFCNNISEEFFERLFLGRYFRRNFAHHSNNR